MQRTLLILLVAASYLLLAGGRTWTLGPLLGLAALAALSAPRRTFAFPRQQRVLDLSLIAICAVLFLQILPVPIAVADLLTPNAARIRAAQQFIALAPAARRWTSLSLDPAATAVSLANVVLAILTFWAARAMFTAAGNTRAFCRALAGLGAAVAIAAILQKSVTPKLVLFLVQPEARSASPFGAFLNRNHMAAWMLMVSAPVAGYLIARLRIHPSYRGSWRAAFKHFMASGAVLTAMALTMILGVLLLTLSRSAVAGLGAGAIVAWRFGRPRMQIERSSVPALLGVAGAMLMASMLFVDIDGWAGRVQQSFDTGPTEFGRVTIWRETLPMMKDFWLTGTGAGTYSEAMGSYQQSRVWVGSMQRWAHFNNAHSHYLQTMSEGGVLLVVPVAVALLALLALGRNAVRADKGEMFWVRVGAAAGLTGIAVQSIWEVALIMPANAVLAGVLAGLLLNRRT